MRGDLACLGEDEGIHFDVTHHPADRYWPLQGIETGLLLGRSHRRMPRAAG